MCMNSYQEVPAELHARWTGARADEDEIEDEDEDEDDDEDEVVSICHFKVELLLSSCPTLQHTSCLRADTKCVFLWVCAWARFLKRHSWPV